jgi:hypothetical protein
MSFGKVTAKSPFPANFDEFSLVKLNVQALFSLVKALMCFYEIAALHSKRSPSHHVSNSTSISVG